MSQDYQTRQLNTKEGNLTGPIRTCHNMHTHTGNTCQPEPQLKSFSCSSAILSHNSRDVILSHNSRNDTCLTLIPSHNSRNMFWATTQGTPVSQTSRHHKNLVDHAHQSKQNPILLQQYRLALLLSRQANHAFKPPSRTISVARCHACRLPSEFIAIAWRFTYYR